MSPIQHARLEVGSFSAAPPGAGSVRIFRHLSDFPAPAEKLVVALGDFDGVDLHHQAVIREAARVAHISGRPLVVVSFEFSTESFVQPHSSLAQITPLRAKLHALEALGVERMIAPSRSDFAFHQLSIEEFVETVLIRGLQAGHVVVGRDVRYGRSGAGTVDTLMAAGAAHGFAVTRVDPVGATDDAIGFPTAIRDLIAGGDLRRAAILLGRPWEISGHVTSGDRRGRQLGFPTANLKLASCLRPAFGIYAVRARLDHPGRHWFDGIANLGVRPMWRLNEPILEVHLFDFCGDIYGQVLRVRLIERLRSEAHFDSVEALVAQVELDKVAARAALQITPSARCD